MLDFITPQIQKNQNFVLMGMKNLKKLSIDNKLPINQCGKLIIASNKKQLKDLEKIYKNSISCNRGGILN